MSNAQTPNSLRWASGTCYLGDVLLSHAVSSAAPSGLRGLTAVFGMGTGVTPSLQSPKTRNTGEMLGAPSQIQQRAPCVLGEFYGQAERAISNGQLHVSPRFHIRPIMQVVFLRPS